MSALPKEACAKLSQFRRQAVSNVTMAWRRVDKTGAEITNGDAIAVRVGDLTEMAPEAKRDPIPASN